MPLAYICVKVILVGLLLGEVIFGVALYWREFCVSKWIGFDNKTAENTKTA